MHDFTTILGVIDLRQRKFGYDTVRQRYRIGNSGITLIMNRFKESELSLDDLNTMEPQKVIDIFYDYYGAAEPPVRCGESHLSGLTEPLLVSVN